MGAKLSTILATWLCVATVCLSDEPRPNAAEPQKTIGDPQSHIREAIDHIDRATEQIKLVCKAFESIKRGNETFLNPENQETIDNLLSQVSKLQQAAAELKEPWNDQIQFQFRMFELTGKSADEWTSHFRVAFGPNNLLNIANDKVDEMLQKLKASGGMKVLAEPVLMTTLGRPANMLSCGEFPIIVPTEGMKTTTEWCKFGTRCQAVAVPAAEPGKLKIKFQMSINERDFSNAVKTAGYTVPGLTTRSVNTEATLRYGETLVISMHAVHPQSSQEGEETPAESKAITVFMVTPSVSKTPKE